MNKKYLLINSSDTLQQAYDHLENHQIIAYDTETTGLNVRKERIIGFSFTGEVEVGYYYPIYQYNPVTAQLDYHPFYNREVCKNLLTKLKYKKLVMHNASYDVRITYNDLSVNLLSSLLADTVLMEHTINEEGPFGLKEICIRRAAELKLDQQDAANQEQLALKESVIARGGKWTGKNKDIYMGELNLLSHYACADVDMTLRLFHYLSGELERQGLTPLFYEHEVMPLYKLVTIRMENRGVGINLTKLHELATDISSDLLSLEKEVVSSLCKLPSWQFYIDSKLQDYPVSNKGSFAQELCKQAGLPLPTGTSGKFSINKKTVEGLSQSKWKNFLITNDPVWLSSYDIRAIRTAMFKKDSESEYLINISSKSQLSELIFIFEEVEPLSKTDKGQPQFNEDFVESISGKFEWASKLRLYNKLSKIKSSYYERFSTLSENGIYYPSFKQHGTTSARYSSDFQQLPRPKDEDSVEHELIKKYNDAVRELVIPIEGYVFIDDDYESLEPRCFADDAGDEALIRIFTDNLDMYSVVAIMAEDIKDASADKKSPDFLKKKYPQVRQNAKAYALGIRYGMKEFKLAKSLDISEERAAEIINNYFKAFPGLKSKMDKYLTEVKTTGKVTSKFGRVRHLPRAAEIYKKYGDEILDYKNLKRISMKTYTPMAELKVIRKEYNNLLNNALNFPIQSAATSIVNRAAIAMTKEFISRKLDAWVSLQIHDQLVISCKEDIAEEVKTIVQSCMEGTNKLAMPLIAKPEIARNLREGH